MYLFIDIYFRVYGDENAILREKEKVWSAEKKDLEKKLLIKEALAAAERKNKGNDSISSITSEDTGIDMDRIVSV